MLATLVTLAGLCILGFFICLLLMSKSSDRRSKLVFNGLSWVSLLFSEVLLDILFFWR